MKGRLLVLALALAGCSGAAPVSLDQPTPQIIHVTPDPASLPTPQIVYVTPDPASVPTPEVIYVTPDPAAQPTPQIIYVTPSPAPTPAATAQPTPTPQPAGYQELSNREWAQLVKAPDNYAGDRVVVWGCITQFDAATGPDQFRAESANRRLQYWFSDGENAYFAGTSSQLAEFVADDVVRMDVTVIGAYTYETTQGGFITVPSFTVDSIVRRGGC